MNPWLDPRTIYCIEEDSDFEFITDYLGEHLTYEAETKVPEVVRVASSAMARRASASASATIPKSFFEKECQEYITLLLALGEEEVMKIDTLQWWADVGI